MTPDEFTSQLAERIADKTGETISEVYVDTLDFGGELGVAVQCDDLGRLHAMRFGYDEGAGALEDHLTEKNLGMVVRMFSDWIERRRAKAAAEKMNGRLR